jgi:tetratricopeptide (TPR) repeat protein
VAVLFAVHPVEVESVAWISEQKNTLSLVFYLAAAFVYLKFDATRKTRFYAWAVTFFVLALGTKSVTATLPAALLVVLWWKRGTLRWRNDVVPLLPWFVAAASAGLFTAWVERALIGAKGAAFDLSFSERLLLAGRVVWFYLGKLVWPTDLMFVYPRWDVPATADHWYGWLAGGLAVTFGLWLLQRRIRGPLAGWLFFVGSLFPALGFFNVYPFLFSYVADHFQYLPSLGIMVVAGVGLARLLAWLSGPLRVGGGVLFGLIVGALAFLTNQQSRIYRDSATLYRATLERNPACWMAHNNLAAELATSPDGVSEALTHYAEALRLKPDYAEAHNNLANTLVAEPGRGAEALAHFEEALRIEPAFVEAHLNLGNALANSPGRMPDALVQYAEALRLKPDYPEAHFALANALATIPGRTADALAEYDAALRLRPDYAEAHGNLAGVLERIPGRINDAAAHYIEALRLTPNIAKTHYNFASLLESIPGREADALVQFLEALRLDPAYAEAHNNLAILFAQQGHLDLAREHWETALKLKPDYEDARRNLLLLQQRQQPR